MAEQTIPASSTRFRRFVSTLLCLLAIAVALLPCTAAMAAMPTHSSATMSMATPAMHCAACCEKKPSSTLAPCCAESGDTSQQISLSPIALPLPAAQVNTLAAPLSSSNQTPFLPSDTLQTRPPLHPILRI